MADLASLRLALIGGGNMTRGLLGGLLGKGADPALITVSAPSSATRESLERTFGVRTTPDNAAAVAGARVVVLSVKPQIMAQVARALAPSLLAARPMPAPLVISVAAGIRMDRLGEWLGTDVPVVRAMPNRPALVGAGATGLYADTGLGAAERALATQVLSATGLAVWVPREDDLEWVTALSGSGPAYFFLLAELMGEVAAARGIEPGVARQLAAQTLAGAGLLVAAQAHPDLARMRAEVASRGGTTEAALDRFNELGLGRLVEAAMQAAASRAREMAELFGNQP